MQPQYNPNNCTFTGYHQTNYWAAAYTTQPLDESAEVTRRGSGMSIPASVSFYINTDFQFPEQPCRRFVSRLRRFLSRDDLKHRRRSEATARTTLS